MNVFPTQFSLWFDRIRRWVVLAFSLFITIAPAAVMGAVTTSVIDWSAGDAQTTDASCGAMVMKNILDHHSYSLWVKGTKAGTCHFESDGLSFHYPVNYGMAQDGTTTLYALQRFGSDVLVTWSPGY